MAPKDPFEQAQSIFHWHYELSYRFSDKNCCGEEGLGLSASVKCIYGIARNIGWTQGLVGLDHCLVQAFQ